MIWTWDVIRRIIEVLWLINIGFAIWTVFRSRRDIAARPISISRSRLYSLYVRWSSIIT